MVRALQRRRRIADGTAGALWDELTATALDLGVRLHPARTPRQTAGELVTLLSRSGGGCARGRGRPAARPGGGGGQLRPGRRARPAGSRTPTTRRPSGRSAGRCSASVSRRSRLLARWWPASLMSGAGARLAERGRERLAGADAGAADGPHRHRLTPSSAPRGGGPWRPALERRQPPSRADGGCREAARATGRSGGGTAPRAGSSAAGGRSGPRAPGDPEPTGPTPGRCRPRRHRWRPCS